MSYCYVVIFSKLTKHFICLKQMSLYDKLYDIAKLLFSDFMDVDEITFSLISGVTFYQFRRNHEPLKYDPSTRLTLHEIMEREKKINPSLYEEKRDYYDNVVKSLVGEIPYIILRM